ncbi:MAG: Spy/CpxP family protein refolding chaperone [Candidatus Delongbacteria bacterium]|nr:Spy/CpxP family protein refolding chaperone [Candidatus Delongbacteria bacterium]
MKKITAVLTLAAAMLMMTFAQATEKEINIEKRMIRGEEMPMMGRMHQGSGMNKRGGDCKMMGEKGGFGPMMFEELDLSKEQIGKIEQIKVKYRKMDIDLDAEKEKLQIDKHQAMQDMNFSEAKNIVKKISDVRLKSQNARIDEMAEITKLLSKDQIEKFRELHSAHGRMGMMKMNRMKK